MSSDRREFDKKTTITIAMATYNGARFLGEQLDSFLHQTRLPDELIVCDDCSTDRTLEILEDYKASAPFRVKVYRNKTNLGYTANFSRAIGLTAGNLIFLSDQDDVWFANKLEKVEQTFAENPDSWVVIHDASITDERLNPTNLTIMGQTKSVGLSEDRHNNGCCTAFRSILVPVLLPVPNRTHTHDQLLYTLAMTLRCRQLVHESLQFYRRHDLNTSAWVTANASPASRWHLTRRMLAESLSRDPLDTCEMRLAQLDAFQQRLDQHAAYLQAHLPSGSSVWQALLDLTEVRNAIESRHNLLGKRKARRLLPALSLYLAGGYSHFSGWKSLTMDMLR